jgi:hypothetical protein
MPLKGQEMVKNKQNYLPTISLTLQLIINHCKSIQYEISSIPVRTTTSQPESSQLVRVFCLPILIRALLLAKLKVNVVFRRFQINNDIQII